MVVKILLKNSYTVSPLVDVQIDPTLTGLFYPWLILNNMIDFLKNLTFPMFFVAPCFLLAQNFFSYKFADSKKADPHFQSAWEMKKSNFENILALERLVMEQPLSEEQWFMLSDLFSQIKNAKSPYLDRFLTTYPKPYRSLIQTKIPIDSLYKLEKQALLLNEQLSDYRAMYLPKTALIEYAVDSSDSRRKELAFYDIQSGNAILEIGAGDEDFIASLARYYNDLTVYVNDVNFLKLKRLYYQTQNNPIFQSNGNRFFVINGNQTSTGMDALKVDKVIIRNALHHFTKPHKMIKAILKNLNRDGVLFILDRYKDQCKENCCEDLWREDQLKMLFLNNDLIVDDQLIIRHWDGQEYWALKIKAPEI